MDSYSHIAEHYFTRTSATDLSDRLCEGAMIAVIRAARILKEDPNDLDARTDLMWAGSLAMNGVLSAGRAGDWASHMIEHEFSALYDVAHGAGLAAVMPAWMSYACETAPERFCQLAVRVWGVDPDLFPTSIAAAKEGIARLRRFISDMGLPLNLKEMGIPADLLEEMASKAAADGPIGQMRRLTKDDILRIYQSILK